MSTGRVCGQLECKPHELERDAQVVSEIEVLGHVDYVVSPVAVFLAQVVQNFHFHQRLVVKSLLVPKKSCHKIIKKCPTRIFSKS